jgi:protein associated with RNAse G/E
MIKKDISVVCFKHNGQFHRSWETFSLIEETDEYFVIGNNISKIMESDGRIWYSKEPGIFIFSKNDFYNVVCMLKRDGVRYYVNLASPCFLKEDVVYYIDYDLDITYSIDQEIKLLDEDEFLENSTKYNYSSKLINEINTQKDKLINKIKNKDFPFNNEIIEKYKEKLKI